MLAKAAREVVDKGKTSKAQTDQDVVSEVAHSTMLQRKKDVFFSNLKKHVQNINAKALLPRDWISQIFNRHKKTGDLSPKPGLSNEQLEWVGIADWLNEQDGKVTKQDVLEFIDQNDIKIEEKILETPKYGRKWSRRQYVKQKMKSFNIERDDDGYYLIKDENGEYLKDINGDKIYESEMGFTENRIQNKSIRLADELTHAQRLEYLGIDVGSLDEADYASTESPKHGRYVLGGESENYKELLLITPSKEAVPPYNEDNVIPINSLDDHSGYRSPERFWYFKTDDNVYQILKSDYSTQESAKQYIIEKKKPSNTDANKFYGHDAHYPDADIQVWVRFNERTDNEGKSVLFIEEIQSDWHQEGRSRGYKNDEGGISNAERKKLHNESKRILSRYNDLGFDSSYQALQTIKHHNERNSVPWSETWDTTDFMPGEVEYINKYLEVVAKYAYNKDGKVQDTVFKQTWHMPAMKRMIRYATENGFDRIAWTTGKQQNERWSLSTQVESINHKKNSDGTYDLRVAPKEGMDTISKTNLTKDNLIELVGKEMAEKIINREGEIDPDSHTAFIRKRGFGVEVFNTADAEVVQSKNIGNRYDLVYKDAVIGEQREKEFMESWKKESSGWYVYYQNGSAHGSFPDKETATRVMENGNIEYTDLSPENDPRVLKGDGLEIGGSGMKGFYDNKLVKSVNKYIKKWGGKVGETKISTQEEGVNSFTMGELRENGLEGIPFSTLIDLDDSVSVENELTGESIPFDSHKDASKYIHDEMKKLIGSKVHSIDVTDQMRDAALEGQPMFKRKRKPKIMKKVGKETGPLSDVKKALKQPVKTYRRLQEMFVHEILDAGLPLRNMVDNVAPDMPASENPYFAWRLLSGDSAVIEDWIGLGGKGTEGTVPYKLEDRIQKKWGKSLRAILEPVMVDTQTFDEFKAYVIAKHAQELKEVGKENLFNDEDIAEGLGFENETFTKAASELYKYNDSLMQYAVDGGFLSTETAEQLKRYSYYVPFFREAEHEGDVGGKRKGGVFKRLTGGKQNIKDPILNIMENTANIIHAVNRNAVLIKAYQLSELHEDGKAWVEKVKMPMQMLKVSSDRVIEGLSEQGVKIDPSSAGDIAIMQTYFQNKPIGDEKNKIVIIKVDGKNAAIKINNADFWKSLHAFAPMELGLVTDIAAIPAGTLRTGIVLSPDFMAANFMRDTFSGFVQAKKGNTMIPVLSTAQGMKQAATTSESYKMYRALGGANADFWHSGSKEEKATLERLETIGKFRPGTVLNPLNVGRWLRKLGTISESGTRLKAMENTFDEDVDNAILSTLEGREISVDFGMHGASKTIRILERITPFLNPAKQGLYKMTRTFGDQGALTLARGSALTALTLLLWLQNRDKEWYKDIEDWEKNTYWHFDIGLRTDKDDVIPVRIPKPFEYGAVFGSFFEAFFEYVEDSLKDADDAGRKAMKRFTSTLEDVFGLRMTPTVAILPIELWSNHSTFTERNIVPESMENIESRYQYGSGTSMFSRKLGEATGMSPYKLDHSVRGLFGTLATYGLMASEQPFTWLADEAQLPSRHWYQMPVIKRFVSDPHRSSTRHMTEFYEKLDKMRTEQNTWKFLDYDMDYLDGLDDLTSFEKPVAEAGAKILSEYRKDNKRIRNDKRLTPAIKQKLIDANKKGMKEAVKIYNMNLGSKP
ncbi:MAG: hypothetical protein OEY17_04345 [Nitrosopumilus sp.]|nr:hypothetical protein [Nitrosopumilus sp.]